MAENHGNGSSPTAECEAVLALISDYAFGLTSDEDRAFVEAQLPHCPEAQVQIAEYRQIQAEMRTSVPQLDPPAALEQRLMAAIQAPAAPAPLPTRRVSRWAWLAAAALLTLVITNVYWFNTVNRLEQQTVISNPTNASFVLTSDADLRWVRLPAAQENSGASAFMLWDGESAIGLMYAVNFPQNATDRIYQLWLTRGEQRISAGNFSVDANGRGMLVFQIENAIDEFTWARITEESDFNAPEPSSFVLVNGELQ